MTNFHANSHPRIVYAWEGEVENLHAEIERLRAALGEIIRVAGGGRAVRNIASRALEQATREEE